MIHKTVLLNESIDGLEIKRGEIYFDGTLGGGGHSERVAELFGNSVQIIATDLDLDALKRAEPRISKYSSNFILENASFRDIDVVLSKNKIEKVNTILLDLGLSSNQIEESGRGFSFQRNEPLMMTFGKDGNDLTASVIVNTWQEESLADIIYGFGEEQFSRRIAKGIIEARETKPITTTFELVEIIQASVPMWYRFRKTHPATKTFQALRIATNSELQALKEGLTKGFEVLCGGGRMAVISFHSLEDRIVKVFFKELSVNGKGILITKKPIIPGEQELKENPRSRSSKLRIIQKA